MPITAENVKEELLRSVTEEDPDVGSFSGGPENPPMWCLAKTKSGVKLMARPARVMEPVPGGHKEIDGVAYRMRYGKKWTSSGYKASFEYLCKKISDMESKGGMFPAKPSRPPSMKRKLEPEEKAMLSDIGAAAKKSLNLLQFIDELAAHNIATIPKLTRVNGLNNLRFERHGLSLSRSQVGVRVEGKLMFSVTRYAEVFKSLIEAQSQGLPQPKILNDAMEVVMAVKDDDPPTMPSMIMTGALQRICTLGKDCPDSTYLSLCAGYDAWCEIPVDELRYELDDDILSGIDSLPEDHKIAALRWACRIKMLELEGYGIDDPQAIALRHQNILMDHLGIERSKTIDTPEP